MSEEYTPSSQVDLRSSPSNPINPNMPLLAVPPPLSNLPRSKARSRRYSKNLGGPRNAAAAPLPPPGPPVKYPQPGVEVSGMAAASSLAASSSNNSSTPSLNSLPRDNSMTVDSTLPSLTTSTSHSIHSTNPSTSTDSQQPIITPPDGSSSSTVPTIPSGSGTGGGVPFPNSQSSQSVEQKSITANAFGESLAERLGQYAQPTGITQMAEAARRGQAGLGISVPAKRSTEEEHPLSDKALKARGYHTILAQRHLFHIPSRFNYVRPLGSGAYGLVILANEPASDTDVAIKCVTRVFDQVILAKRALREISLLKHFSLQGGNKNLSGLVDLDSVWEGYNEIYFYLEPLQTDLHHVIHKSKEMLSLGHIKWIFYQILRGMKYVHSANVIHRDLKPGNILLNEDCEVRVCDFGLARGFYPVKGEEDQNQQLLLTEHVATKWYRAPEVLLHHRRYTTAIDVWSIGCILAELLTRKTLFPGEGTLDQLKLILGVLGTPNDELMSRVANEKSAEMVRSLGLYEPRPLSEVIPEADPEALDLLSRLLDINPFTRITVPEAIKHPWLTGLHVPYDEPDCPEVFSQWEEVEKLDSVEAIREVITREIEEYREMVRNQAYEDDSDVFSEGYTSGEDNGGSTPGMLGVDSTGAVYMTPMTTSSLGMSPRDSTDASATMPPQYGNELSRGSTLEMDKRQDTVVRGPLAPRKRTTSSKLFQRDFSPVQGTHSRLPDQDIAVESPSTSSSTTASRKSSFHQHRRPNSSFLFGSGMTPMSQRPNTIIGDEALSSMTMSGRRPKSRTPSLAAAEFGAVRPIVRGLSSMNLHDLGQRAREEGCEDALAGGDEVLPRDGRLDPEGKGAAPMLVSPRDAPPSAQSNL
ncbi:kinase-like domain-containing protein [Kockovaella imperatae]|uniref:Mitogen-activated protein kinase n=1 Tax=Kockovaella imperatae TaxID=4999 RepID=A0A1Y1UR62_9TREE|nr:kinase-like domain-containing protein [Kockovaella imperatae]ORX40553.1 kinase-like domain-containing protein [Kockovaella imperatae]